MTTVHRAAGALAILVMTAQGGAALAQPTPPTQPTPPPPDAPPPVGDQPVPPPDVASTPGTPNDGVPPGDMNEQTGTLRLHIISSRNTYVPMGFDVFSVERRWATRSGMSSRRSRNGGMAMSNTRMR